MLESVILMGGLGILIGTSLAVASKVFYVYVDPKVEAVEGALPGANCGGCGFPGCSPNAEAIVEGKSGVDSCVAAGPDVAQAIAGIMGVSVSEKEPEFAAPGCYYPREETDIKYLYEGISDCRAASLLFGGMKECRIGCLGLGTCVAACPFDALEMGEDSLPKVDEEKCTGCGTCERVCPKHIITLTSTTRRIIREYTEGQCVTPCQRACPAGIDIREYIRLIRKGDYEGAVQRIKERNPFPTVIGRICPAFCEFECRRQLVDEPVAINHLKRFVCDLEMDSGKRVMPYKAPQTGKRVAVIGGGAEGLSAAFFLARLGHDAVVFEGSALLGGLLRYAIAEERLPVDVLEWDIEGILEAGVKVKTGMRSGVDFTVPGLLKQGYQTVFAASGGWDSRLARGEGGRMATIFPGCYLMIDLLLADPDDRIEMACGRDVVIAGGGREPPRAVTMLKGLGAERITVVSRRTAEASSLDSQTVEVLEEAGVSLVYNGGVTKVAGEEDNLTHIEYTVLDTGEKYTLGADSLIMAAGRFPELVFVPATPLDEAAADFPEEGMPLKWTGVEGYKPPVGGRESGLFSRTDVTSGYTAAISAINGGRKAAAAIHHLMYGMPFVPSANLITGQSVLQSQSRLENVEVSPRNIMPLSDRSETRAVGRKELYPGFPEEVAVKEAGRCLRCGLLCYERSRMAAEEPSA